MKTYTRWITFSVISVLGFLIGCTSFAKPLASPTGMPVFPSSIPPTMTTSNENFTPTPIQENTLTPFLTLTATPLPSGTPTAFTPTWTPLPTLNAEDTQALLKDLFENNAACQLSCWWGFIPGKTSWQEAERFLSQFAIYIGKFSGRSEGVSISNVKIPPPSTTVESKWVDVKYVTQDYLIRDGIIETINIYNFDLIPNYYLPAFLESYGKPGGIWIRTFAEEEQSQPFLLDLFYPNQGILMEYSGGTGSDLGDHLQICLEGMNSPFIYLWAPEQSMTFEGATRIFLDTENLPEPVSLKDATGMDVDTFYERFMSDGKVCIETPKELWPDQ